MTVSLVALFPNHLNLNGDLANIKVLKQRLAWRNVDAEVTFIHKGDDLPESVDFVLVGHGSEAAWADLQEDLERLKPALVQLIQAGLPALAVASGYERFFTLPAGVSFGLFPLGVSRVDRSSRFVLAQLGENRALGYVNSDASLEPMMRFENLIGTLLHGPVLAKNEWLADALIEAIFLRRGQALPEIQAKEKAGQVADLIARIWKLEEPLARE